jgi:hypothetical protein
MGQRFDYMGLTNAAPQRVARLSFLVINELQEGKHHEQIVASAVVFLLICEALKVSPQDVFTATKNLLSDEREGGQEQFRAIQAYVAGELAR